MTLAGYFLHLETPGLPACYPLMYTGQEATVRTGHGTTDWFQLGQGVRRAVYCHPVYLSSMKSTL